MQHYHALKKIMPLELGAFADAEMVVEGQLLDRMGDTITNFAMEFFAGTAVRLLDLFEMEYDIEPPSGASIAARQQVIAARIRDRGGLSRSDLISAAVNLGFSIDITEPCEVTPPFRAGISRVGDPIYGFDIIWSVIITSLNKPFTDDFKQDFAMLMPPHLKITFIE